MVPSNLLTIYCPTDLRDQLRALASFRGESISSYARTAITAKLKADPYRVEALSKMVAERLVAEDDANG